MIGEVTLTNWKRHSDLTLEFQEGLNFLLGSNGRGKTSVFEAIRFALCGSDDPQQQAEVIRFDEAEASVQLQLVGDPNVVISRAVHHDGGLTGAVTGAKGSVDDVVFERFGAAPVFLRSMLFLGEGEAFHGGDIGSAVEQQLGTIMSMSAMEELLGSVPGLRRSLSRDQRAQRAELKLSRSQVEELGVQERQLALELDELKSNEEVLRQRHSDIAAITRRREQRIEQAAQIEQWRAEMEQLAQECELRSSDPEGLLNALNERRAHIEDQLHALAEQRGRLEGRIATLQSFVAELLDRDVRECPMCQQTLDAEHRNGAITTHQSALSALAAELDALSVETARATVDRERWSQALTAMQALVRRQPSGMTSDVDELDDTGQSVEQATTELDELRVRRAHVEAEWLSVREQLAVSEAELSTEARVTAAFQREAFLEVIEQGVERFMRNLRSSVMGPIAAQLAQQWKSFRPDAEWSLALDGLGRPCLARSGETRPYSALSGGEKTVASVLLRIALTVAITKSDVLVLDEPLEHLDPRARRLMVSSLHRAVRQGLLKQVLISTYEESLVRRLVDRDGVAAIWLDRGESE